jgi:hypothetical protein
MQALKMFAGGNESSGSSGGGMDKNKLIGLAMVNSRLLIPRLKEPFSTIIPNQKNRKKNIPHHPQNWFF